MKEPPAIPLPDESAQRWWRPWEYLGWLILFGVGYKVVAALGLPIPTCPMREFVGIPCPFCGGTRSVSAALSLEFGEALLFNPLVFLGVMVFGVLLIASCFRPARVRRGVNQFVSLFDKRGWRTVAVVVLMANWVYLLVNGRFDTL